MYVYILVSQNDGSHYVGLTADIDTRLKQHNAGRNYSTKRKRPWKLVHAEIVETRSQARILENFFKSGYGRETIKEIEA